MRAIVCADLEGTGGVDAFEACYPSWPDDYRHARELMEGEVNAVLAGLRDAGVEDVLVTDWHFAGTNLRRDRVEAPVRGLWVGGEPTMSPWVYGDRDLAIFVGMHAAAGARSFMAHTFWQGLAASIDGTPVNEAYLWATMVASAGARIGFVAGEDRLVEECAALLPGVPVIPVKSSVSRHRANTVRAPEDIRHELRQAAADAARAVQADPSARPSFPAPVGREVTVTFQEESWARRFAQGGHGERVGPLSVSTNLQTPDGLVPLLAAATLALPSGRETSLYTRIAPAPEWTGRSEFVRRLLTSCIHAVGAPLMRRGVRKTQRMEQSRYPTPPGEKDGPGTEPPPWIESC